MRWVVLLFSVVLWAEEPLGTVTPVVPPGALPAGALQLSPPNKPALEDADARSMIETQRLQQSRWAEYYKKRAEMYEAEKVALTSDQDVYKKLSTLKVKYSCQGCDLGWDMKWMPPEGMSFAKPKEEEKKPPLPED